MVRFNFVFMYAEIFPLSSVAQPWKKNLQRVCHVPYHQGGHAVAQLVEATSQNVAGTIPNGVTGIFH